MPGQAQQTDRPQPSPGRVSQAPGEPVQEPPGQDPRTDRRPERASQVLGLPERELPERDPQTDQLQVRPSRDRASRRWDEPARE